MKRNLVIASRKSDLARLQAQSVAEALRNKFPDIEVELFYRESLGDKNLSDPLWKMPEKGVFTQDFLADLLAERFDAVVHSWKDLPLESDGQTQIVGAPLRADARDLLLFKKTSQARLGAGKKINIYSSSPRRAYNLEKFLRQALPHAPQALEFLPVRGNVPTRFRKLLENPDVDALVVAKAALDRLLASHADDFAEARAYLKNALKELDFMVLPLRENPAAAAQGALAIEVKSTRTDLIELFAQLCDPESTAAARLEREVLGRYGGGCHQKIGVSVLPQPYGRVFFLRGETKNGELLNEASLLRAGRLATLKPAALAWPESPQDVQFFDREILKDVPESSAPALWIAKADALPPHWKLEHRPYLWTAGLKTWYDLARRGHWVHGSSEALGEAWSPGLDTLVGAPLAWLKLSHDEGVKTLPLLATYRLREKAQIPNLSGKKFFYWMSASAFEVALKHYPEILTAQHASGPGHTADHLRQVLGPQGRLEIYLDFSDWKKSLHSP